MNPEIVVKLKREVYRARYKEGPVHKEIFFYGNGIEDAREQYKKYIEFLRRTIDHNRSITAIGQVEPFAIDVDKLIESQEKKNEIVSAN